MLLGLIDTSSLDAVLLLAMDYPYDEKGNCLKQKAKFFVPNDHVLDLAKKYSQIFSACSIHPARKDAIEELERCAERGAKVLKLLPNCHNLDCSDPRYRPFWEKLAQLGLPFLAHTGGEFSVPVLNSKFADPRLLRLPLECGVTVIAAHGAGKSGLFDPDYTEDLLRMIDELKLTHMHVVPTMFVRLLRLPAEVRAKYDVSSLVHVIHGAAPCPPDVKRQMIEWWGPVIYEYYGSTENGIVTVVTSEMALSKHGTVGKPIAGNVIRILDDDGKDLPPGEIGEVYIWRPNRTDFTYNKRDAARKEMEIDGFLTNGDMGWLDADGCLFLADRKNDMVISGGVNIYPAEIEKVLIGCPGVRDCAVFGIPDAEFGESLAAHIEVTDPALAPEDVQAYLREHLAKFKVPRKIVIDEALPREDSGKIFKRKIREPYWAGMPRRI